MDKEQIISLAEEQGAVANLKQHFNIAGDSIVFTPEELEAFFNAAIESYKAELLKEAGEPVLLELSEGETYIGCIGDAFGNLYHVILLPGDNDDATHEAQIEWAKSIGGDLPNRIEQAMLWANHRDQFKKEWYWSEIHHSESGWAWCQYFGDGTQGSGDRGIELRARAVRRIKDRNEMTQTIEQLTAIKRLYGTEEKTNS